MQDKTDVVSQAVAQTGSVISIGSGLWVWLGQNHDQIAVICAIIGALVAIFGAVVNFFHKRKVEKLILSNQVLTQEDIQKFLHKK